MQHLIRYYIPTYPLIWLASWNPVFQLRPFKWFHSGLPRAKLIRIHSATGECPWFNGRKDHWMRSIEHSLVPLPFNIVLHSNFKSKVFDEISWEIHTVKAQMHAHTQYNIKPMHCGNNPTHFVPTFTLLIFICIYISEWYVPHVRALLWNHFQSSFSSNEYHFRHTNFSSFCYQCTTHLSGDQRCLYKQTKNNCNHRKWW